MERKIIVITGSSSGIGAALARHLGQQGHSLVLAARREKELRKVADISGTKALTVATDVTVRQDMENLRNAAIKEFGHIDVWINNAGRGILKNVLDLTDEDVDVMIKVNLKSVLYGMQTIIPHFQQRGKGHLINISSFLGRVPFVPARSVYNAAKAGVNSLTANLRMDLKAGYPGIHISLVMPGMVATEFAGNSLGATSKAGTAPSQGQNVDEVAAIIAGLLENPVAEIFTNPGSADMARLYYQDIAAFEEKTGRK